MSTFTAQEVDALAWVYVASRNRDKDRKVEPGDFGTRGQAAGAWGDFPQQPIACCCTPRRVSLAMAKGSNDDDHAAQDRSDFTRESFGSGI